MLSGKSSIFHCLVKKSKIDIKINVVFVGSFYHIHTLFVGMVSTQLVLSNVI